MAANQGIAPPDYKTPVGMIRLYLGDTDPTDVAQGVGTYIWHSDDELEAFLAATTNPKRVAVRILRNIAVSEAMLFKKWRSADLQVDGAAITDSILKAADALEAEINDDDSAAGSELFSIVPTQGVDPVARSTRYDSLTPEEADRYYPRLGLI